MTTEERVQQIIDTGGTIQINFGMDVVEVSLAAVAWPAPGQLRWCGIFPEHQSHVHTLSYDEKMLSGGELFVFFKRGGEFVATIAPYDEAATLPPDEVRQAIDEWRRVLAVPGNQEQFDEFFAQA